MDVNVDVDKVVVMNKGVDVNVGVDKVVGWM